VSWQKRASMNLDSDPRSAARARKSVRDFLSGCDGRFVETAALLTDELVTNAVVHGSQPLALTFDLGEDRLRVSVTDGTMSMPRIMSPSVTREHGRGISIVDALSTRWGTHVAGEVKEVWFELLVPDGIASPRDDDQLTG
jgi:anti-sigma regulatory factor (Ser/Thr protein kinase)